MSVIAAGAVAPLASTARARSASHPESPTLEGVFDVTRYGAVGDGATLATAGIQKAIDACAKAGGGLVFMPPGRFLSGALFLRSNVHLHISAGAVLAGSQRPEDFPPVDSRWEGIERKTHASLLNGDRIENVAIEGHGVIDGQGLPWWQAAHATMKARLARELPREAENPPEAPLKWPRPRAITLIRCQGVMVSGLTIRDAPSYNLHLIYCQDVVVEGLNIVGMQVQNADGITVDSCKQVRIANCSIGSGGESISLKAGYNEDGRRVGLPCEDVVVSNCNLYFSRGAGFACGSETAGGIRNVTLTNCIITNCRLGIHLRSPRGRGGGVQRVRVSNVVLDNISETAIVISHFFDSLRMDQLFGEPAAPPGNPETDRALKAPVGEGTPEFADIELRGLSIGLVRDVALLEGLPERFIQGVSLQDIAAPRAKSGITCTHVASLQLSHFTVNAAEGPAVAARDVEGLEIHRLKSVQVRASAPLVDLDRVAGAFIHGCTTLHGGADFVRLRGAGNRRVVLLENQASRVPKEAPKAAPEPARKARG